MLKYVIRRLLVMIPVLLGVTVLITLLINLSPGDPARAALGAQADAQAVANLRQEIGLDQPVYIRYIEWVAGVLQGDLGTSIVTGEPVNQMIMERLPATLELSIVAIAITFVIALPLGVISAVRQYTWMDTGSMVFAIFWLSMPSFWLGLILILLFSVELGITPISGRSGTIFTVEWLSYLALPAFAIGARRAGLLTRLTRSSMLEIINEEYIRTAKGKGIGGRAVIYTHAMKNAMIPIATLVGLQIPMVLSGSVIIEYVFSWPGIGRLLVDSVSRRDYPVVQGIVLVYAVIVLFANLIVDIAYTQFDPRVTYD
ncbi:MULTISPECIES: ABC transporter permease [Natrialba]|uniref:ABC transporter permease n=1 Tax=Natrialba swarupiae TaxID=2448032 RepID=A0A5D5ALE0_9EURY|nr:MULTISPECIES: ABC transporter permease [Natrialba]MWV41965.1 ABC transporter permease subunit [Natrialba sp. INN-245]TYT61657.1 ABC transporter permease [Natrialba swarupiae]